MEAGSAFVEARRVLRDTRDPFRHLLEQAVVRKTRQVRYRALHSGRPAPCDSGGCGALQTWLFGVRSHHRGPPVTSSAIALPYPPVSLQVIDIVPLWTWKPRRIGNPGPAEVHDLSLFVRLQQAFGDVAPVLEELHTCLSPRRSLGFGGERPSLVRYSWLVLLFRPWRRSSAPTDGDTRFPEPAGHQVNEHVVSRLVARVGGSLVIRHCRALPAGLPQFGLQAGELTNVLSHSSNSSTTS